MKKRRIISLALASMIMTSSLTSCGFELTKAEAARETEVISEIVSLHIDKYDEKGEDKIYQEYEHLFMARYNLCNELHSDYIDDLSGVSIEIPEGYEIVSIQNFNGLGGKIGTTATHGFDVWYTNKVPVVVSPVYNELMKKYDYSCPGKVIDIEKEIDTEKVLTK